MSALFRFDRSWQFDAPLDTLWGAIADTASYPRLWPWLDDFHSGPLVPGTVARFRVRPPLPYRLWFTVEVDEVVDRQRVTALVGGDVEGPARLDVSATPAGSEAHLAWELELRRPGLARTAPLVRPLLLLGHNIVVAMGIRQFKKNAL